MIERLLKCKLCGGNVSSGATKCPHCGTYNFKSASYLTEMELMRQAMQQKQVADMINRYRQQGYLTSVFSKEMRAYFPNEASISIKMNHVSSKNVYTKSYNCFGFIVYFDGKPTDAKWIYHYDTEYGTQEGGDVIVPTGPHRITVRHTSTEFAGKQSVFDFDIIITRSSKTIMVDYSFQNEFWSGKPKLKDVKVYVK